MEKIYTLYIWNEHCWIFINHKTQPRAVGVISAPVGPKITQTRWGGGVKVKGSTTPLRIRTVCICINVIKSFMLVYAVCVYVYISLTAD